MNKLVTPQSADWDRFWQATPKGSSLGSENISWSKKRIMAVLEPFAVGGAKALDAGCGSGFFSKYFCERGLTAVSVDYSDSALERARKVTQGRSKVLKADLLNERLAEKLQERFDIIFSDGLFEHFAKENQDRIMQNFLSVLDPQGVIITFVPNRWSPWELIRPFFMPGIDETPFIAGGLARLHEDNNLTILQAGGVNTLPFLFSPDRLLGRYFGMLLYAIAKKNA